MNLCVITASSPLRLDNDVGPAVSSPVHPKGVWMGLRVKVLSIPVKFFHNKPENLFFYGPPLWTFLKDKQYLAFIQGASSFIALFLSLNHLFS